MAQEKRSFLSNLIGSNTYEELKYYAKFILAIGTCVLAVLYLLSIFFHWSFISRLLNLTTGTSLLFIVYIASVIICLDKEVEVDEPESSYWSKPANTPKTPPYRLTIVWGILLMVLGITAIFFSNRYRKQYAFDCSTIMVDREAGIYHLEWIEDCEIAAESEDLKEMKGYEIKGLNYRFCDWCREYVEEAEDAYIQDQY